MATWKDINLPVRASGVSSKLAAGIDKAIEVFSPQWAAERRMWRAAYRAATFNRYAPAREHTTSPDYESEVGFSRHRMIDRARQLERDNAIAAGLLNRSTENVIAEGIPIQAKTSSEDWNKRAEELWRAWGERDADVRGMDSLASLQALAYRSWIRDGDVGTIKLATGQLQMVESDQIAAPIGKQNVSDPKNVDGVEVDAVGRPIRYHIVTDDMERIRPYRRWSQKRKTIAARDFIFLSNRTRIGQTRGIPFCSQNAWLFEQLDDHIEAIVVAARMAACFGLIITSASSHAGLPTLKGADGRDRKEWNLEPGMVKRINPGESVDQLVPQHPKQNIAEFIRILSRLLGLPLGIPLELVALDFSQTNFSSARAALLQAYRSFRCKQRGFIEGWLSPIYHWRIRRWMLEGELPFRDDWMVHDAIPPGWAWIDPVKEVQAAALSLDLGMDTLTDIVRAQGRDFYDLVERRKREISAMREAEIPDVRSVMTRDPVDHEGDAEVAREAAEEAAARGVVETQKTRRVVDELGAEVRSTFASMELKVRESVARIASSPMRVRKLKAAIAVDPGLGARVKAGDIPPGYTVADAERAFDG